MSAADPEKKKETRNRRKCVWRVLRGIGTERRAVEKSEQTGMESTSPRDECNIHRGLTGPELAADTVGFVRTQL